jgi:hypothetical protein
MIYSKLLKDSKVAPCFCSHVFAFQERKLPNETHVPLHTFQVPEATHLSKRYGLNPAQPRRHRHLIRGHD